MPSSSTEPRGPHLPDAVTEIPALAWLFILLAAARLVWAVNQAGFGPAPEPSTVVSYVIGSIPPMVAVLLPVAFLARHPDAASRARTLLAGTVLIAIAEGLRVLADPLEPIFEQVTAASEEAPFLVPMTVAYSALASLVGTFGVANMALGLAQARRYEDRPRARGSPWDPCGHRLDLPCRHVCAWRPSRRGARMGLVGGCARRLPGPGCLHRWCRSRSLPR